MKIAQYLFLIPFFFLLTDNVFSQKQDSPIREVKINLMVSDEKNNSIEDIKPEEVKLYENGVEQKITKFEKKIPLNLGIVVDNSGSMRTRINETILAASTLISNLLEGDESFLIRFVNSDKIEVSQDWTSDKQQLKEAAQNMFIEAGQSAVIDALYLSAEKIIERAQKDDTKRYALVLISDGYELDSFYKLKDVMKLLEGKNVQIFSLAIIETDKIPKEKVEGLIRKITLKTGGAAYYPKRWKKEKGDENELVKALKALIFELRSQYLISYVPTNKNFEEEKRKLKVVISDNANGEKRHAILRESFTAKEK